MHFSHDANNIWRQSRLLFVDPKWFLKFELILVIDVGIGVADWELTFQFGSTEFPV